MVGMCDIYPKRLDITKEIIGTDAPGYLTSDFDQMNWWLDAEPEEAHAFSKVNFYGNNIVFHYHNCRKYPFADKCDFYRDITKNKRYMKFYVTCEEVDEYLRDSCV